MCAKCCAKQICHVNVQIKFNESNADFFSANLNFSDRMPVNVMMWCISMAVMCLFGSCLYRLVSFYLMEIYLILWCNTKCWEKSCTNTNAMKWNVERIHLIQLRNSNFSKHCRRAYAAWINWWSELKIDVFSHGHGWVEGRWVDRSTGWTIQIKWLRLHFIVKCTTNLNWIARLSFKMTYTLHTYARIREFRWLDCTNWKVQMTVPSTWQMHTE